MPSKSSKQKKFMAAAAHDPKFARKAKIKHKVALDFHKADKKAKKGKARGGYGASGPSY